MFKGWEKVVGETTQLDLTGNENNQLSSVRVRPGCTLHLFKNSNNDGSKESVTSDVRYYAFPGINHGLNDQVSSLSCTCTENDIRPPPRPGKVWILKEVPLEKCNSE
jgi:hypothetical protein